MSNKTTNYNLSKPLDGEYYDVGVPNANMDLIDAELKKAQTHRENFNNPHGVTAAQLSLTSPTSLTLYVSPNGLDDNDGLTIGTSFLTIQKALSLGNPWTSLTIYIDDGTYNFSGITLHNSPSISIIGLNGDKAKVIINTGFSCEYMKTAQLRYLTCKTVYSGQSNVSVLDCDIECENSRIGVNAEGMSTVTVKNTIINNATNAIQSANGSIVRSDTNSGSGNGNGLMANGGIILAVGTQPTGTNAKNTLNAGMIFSSNLDYEVGAWNPVLKVNNVVNNTGSKSGWYVKFGKTVIIGCRIGTVGTLGSGNVTVSGLPWPAACNVCHVINITDSLTTTFALASLLQDYTAFSLFKIQASLAYFDGAVVTGLQPLIHFQFSYQTW